MQIFVTKTSVNYLNTLSYSLKHAYQNSFLSTKFNCTTTQVIENIILSLKSLNSFGYDVVPTKILNYVPVSLGQS